MDSIRELSVIEATSRSMLGKSTFPLAAHFHTTEFSFTPFVSRALVLTLLTFSIVFCSAACSRGSAKERELWRRPLIYPSSVPIIGNLLWMGWDSSGFMSAVV